MEKNISMNRIRELREDRDLLQIEVAKQVGIVPDSFAIIKLAEFFGVTCDYLLGVTERNIANNNSVLNELDNIIKRVESIKRYLTKK